MSTDATTAETSSPRIVGRMLFGYSHPGPHCPCADAVAGFMDPVDEPPNGPLLTMTLNGREYVTDRYVLILRDAVDLTTFPDPSPYLGDTSSAEANLVHLDRELPLHPDVLVTPSLYTRVLSAGLTVGEGRDPDNHLSEKAVFLDGRQVGWMQPARPGPGSCSPRQAVASQRVAGLLASLTGDRVDVDYVARVLTTFQDLVVEGQI